MRGLMMDMPLMISSLIRHADQFHGDTQIVTRLTEGGTHRYTYAEAHRRSRQLANALLGLGVAAGERIGTLAWNNHRHFELYFGISGIGAICHTVNPRLFAEQIIYIINHAEDRAIFFDLSFVPLVEQLAPHCPTVKTWVLMTEHSHLPKQTGLAGLTCYEDLINGHSDVLSWPEFEEHAASSMCYTSGTTGNPKGVVYSHRSTLLHALASALPDVTGISARDVILPVVPMFHANAWGLNYSAPMVGAKLVFPGPFLDGKNLFEMYEQEGVTFTAGVPTIWLGLLTFMRENKLKFSTLKRATVGGAACPPAIIRAFQDEYGVQMLHGWGMTETSPVGTLNSFKAKHAGLSGEERLALQAKQGRAIFGVQLKLVDGQGKQLPHDGSAFGDLLVRGPWVASGYFKQEGGDVLRRDENGQEWFPTGDVANIDPDGYLQITDRSKDVIKSGGEWISSIDLENVAIGHPSVAEAAVIGVAHPKWDERPLLIVVRKSGASVTREELLAFYEGKVAKWSQPDDVVFVDSLPHTATGKLLKTKLRQDFAAHRLPTSGA